MAQKKSASAPWNRHTFQPEQVLAVGFLLVILTGAGLLCLPAASADGKSAGFFDSLFTSTSAVCVTGLVVRDTATQWSRLGHVILICLIQMGGLGFMVFATLVMVALGLRITLRERMVLKESLNESTLSGLVRVTMGYGALALFIELIGAAILSTRLIPKYGWSEGLFYSIFHSISAFCNAGFDLFGHYSSLTSFTHDPVILFTIAGLIILGGLGFSVILECLRHHFRWRKLSLHAKVALGGTGFLLLIGMLFFCIVEWNNPATLGALPMGDRLVNGFFQSATLRTAGFNSIDQASLKEASKLMSVMLMFVGASPASTGGGVKTTTMGVLILIVISVIRGHRDVYIMGRRLPNELMRRALTILFISLAMLLAGSMALTLLEGEQLPFLDLLFECASALGTVGVSSVGTPTLSWASKVFLVPLMFFGRVGPLTLALALANKQNSVQEHIKYPEDKVMIG